MSVFSGSCLSGGLYLVTGASSGIGRTVALRISESGGRVVVSGRDETRLRAVQVALAGSGHVLSRMVLDNGDGATEWVKNLAQEHGPLNGIFHAAGIELVRPVRLTKDADVQKLFGAALYPAMGIARAVAQKGVVHDAASIVFMSSVAAQCGQSGMSAYCASKAAVDGLVRALSCEFAARKIRVNSIVAGAVVTEMHHRLTQTMGQDALTKYEEQHLLGFGSQDDVADAAIFLLSSASKWITGSSMAVDGGYMVR